jgi:hypothetical protein
MRMLYIIIIILFFLTGCPSDNNLITDYESELSHAIQYHNCELLYAMHKAALQANAFENDLYKIRALIPELNSCYNPIQQKLNTLCSIYGPADCLGSLFDIYIDLNSDGTEEVIIFFFNEYYDFDVRIDDLENGVKCLGFAVFTYVFDDYEPIFYHNPVEIINLRLRQDSHFGKHLYYKNESENIEIICGWFQQDDKKDKGRWVGKYRNLKNESKKDNKWRNNLFYYVQGN